MRYLNKTLHNYSYAKENIEIIIYSLISFFTPFLIGHPQLLVGTIINFLLIKSAFQTNFKKTLPIIILPSLSVFFRGMMFGNLTKQLIYLIPFIILGNLTLVLISKQYFKKNKHIIGKPLLGILIKVAIIFIGTIIVYAIGLVPIFFLHTMASLQIITALIALFFFTTELKIRHKI
jgi:hypothetical protein